jgi:hypothetical protein
MVGVKESQPLLNYWLNTYPIYINGVTPLAGEMMQVSKAVWRC